MGALYFTPESVCDYSQGKLHFIVGAALLLLFLLLLAFVLALFAHQREVSFCFSFFCHM